MLRLALAAGSRSADDGKEHEERLVTVLILLPEIKAFPPEAKFLFTMINYATYLLIDFLVSESNVRRHVHPMLAAYDGPCVAGCAGRRQPIATIVLRRLRPVATIGFPVRP